ncbi:APO protein 2, chloroplastic [Euphorbia lathyris]|uniref:APO protein 2, chloroplastic n=1 Tax=Euphorbia lathyris TaxID=212925 RepID=UPI0033134663
MSLFNCKLTGFHPKLEVFTVYHRPSSQSLQLKLYPGLSSLHSFQYSGSKLGHELKLVTTSRKLKQPHALSITSELPQNADFPRTYSRKEKKPFPVPILELRRAARERCKNRKGKPKGISSPPKNGLVVRSLIPLAYDVLNARTSLINNLKKLLKVVPVHACGWCHEIHVGSVGHPFKSCKGKYATLRKGEHEWTNATIEDILVPIEAYHLFDRLGKRIPHEQRFSIPRIPAVVELCIQAGVNIPEYPTKRRRKPIIRINKSEFIDADESDLPDPAPAVPEMPILPEIPDSEIAAPSDKEETRFIAAETLRTWEKMRKGSKKLMKMYLVRVCGYCPEVHVGSSGHKAQNCGAHKHQQRNGQHGWQAAVLDDLIPPRYVWHVPDTNEPLQRELRSFYGKAPAVVEICIQAGASVPEEYKSTMRLDIGIPNSVKEAEMVV